jgi:hypothetical protein
MHAPCTTPSLYEKPKTLIALENLQNILSDQHADFSKNLNKTRFSNMDYTIQEIGINLFVLMISENTGKYTVRVTTTPGNQKVEQMVKDHFKSQEGKSINWPAFNKIFINGIKQ